MADETTQQDVATTGTAGTGASKPRAAKTITKQTTEVRIHLALPNELYAELEAGAQEADREVNGMVLRAIKKLGAAAIVEAGK